MSDATYRIKPLKWEIDYQRTECESHGADALDWSFEVCRHDGVWDWGWYLGGSYELGKPCDSLEDGKAKAEAFYRVRLLEGLEKVTL